MTARDLASSGPNCAAQAFMSWKYCSVIQVFRSQLSPMRLKAASAATESLNLAAMSANRFTLVIEGPYFCSAAAKPFCMRAQDMRLNSGSSQGQAKGLPPWRCWDSIWCAAKANQFGA